MFAEDRADAAFGVGGIGFLSEGGAGFAQAVVREAVDQIAHFRESGGGDGKRTVAHGEQGGGGKWIGGQLAADSEGFAGLDEVDVQARQGLHKPRVEGVEQVFDPRVVAVEGEELFREVVGADGRIVRMRHEVGDMEQGRGDLDHQA